MKSIFISSTFRDMQAERDVLHQQVFPALRKRLAACGEDVQELDLRWGVDTSRLSEEKSGELVIETCIDGIDRCKPYMVVLLGNRYGWVPEQKTVDSVADERVRQWYETGSSITQLEIRYGALRQEIEPDRCIFCFRDESFVEQVPEAHRAVYATESEDHGRKLQALKQEIRSREQARILDYQAVWDETRQAPGGLGGFAEKLTELLWELLSRDLEHRAADASPEEQILRDADLTARQYLSSYVSRRIDRETGPSALMGRAAIWFCGDAGSGKSALMAKIAANGRKVGAKVFLYYGGNAGCARVDTLVRALIHWFNSIDSEEPISASPMADRNISILDRLLLRKRTFDFAILIDGVDQMEDRTRGFLCWLRRRLVPEEQEQAGSWHGLAVSSTAAYADRWEKQLASDFSIRRLEPLNNSELDAIAQSHSARRGKKLDGEVMAHIRRKAGSRNPYYLSLLLQKLFMMDQRDFERAEALAPGMEGLSRFMCLEMDAMPEAAEEMTVALLWETCDKLSVRMAEYAGACENVAEPMKVLKLLAVSRSGLTIAEITKVLELAEYSFPPMYLEHLFSYLYDSFAESQKGVWDFRHRLLREGLLKDVTPELYRAYSGMLLALRLTQNASGDELMYYACQAENEAVGLKLLHDKRVRLTLHADTLLQMLESEQGTGYLVRLLKQTESGRVSELLQELLRAADRLYRNPAGLQAVLEATEPTQNSAPEHRVYHGLLRQKLQFWQLDPAEFCRGWQQLRQVLLQLGPDALEDSPQVFAHCQEILGQRRYWDIWEEVLAVLGSMKPASYLQRRYDATVQWAAAICRWRQALQAGSGEREAYAAALELLKRYNGGYGVVTDSWLVMLMEYALEKKRYQDVFDLLQQRIPYLERQFDLGGGTEAAMRLIGALKAFGGAVQEKTGIRYIRKAADVCRRILSDCPLPYLRWLECTTGMVMWEMLENLGEEESYRCLDRVIEQADSLIRDVGADQIPVQQLQKLLEQRYFRLVRRRKLPYDTDKAGFCVAPWRYDKVQEADFLSLQMQYPKLEARCTTYSVYVDMAWTALEKVRFYDACHREDELVAAAGQVIKMAQFMVDTKQRYLFWVSLGFRLELGEILQRRYYGATAADLADEALRMMQSLDTRWIVDTNRVTDYNRRTVRCYLLLAKTKMRKPELREKALNYALAALQKLDGGNGKQPMDDSFDDLRWEAWIVLGSVRSLMGQPWAEDMAQADRFWSEKRIDAILRAGGHEKLVKLLRYGQSLSTRGCQCDDPALVAKAVDIFCRLANSQTPSGTAASWEQLYDELIKTCRYYWKKRETLSAPQTLMIAMVQVLAEKKELKREEQILLAEYGLQLQLPAEVSGTVLPDEKTAERILEQIIALNRGTGVGRLRARLALAKLLRGNYEGACAEAENMVGIRTPQEMRVLLLVSMLANNLMTKIPPKEPRLPMVREWAETLTGRQEPVLARYLELAAAVADSRAEGEEGLRAALFGLTLLEQYMEALGKQTSESVLPEWAAVLCRRVMTQEQALEDEACANALRAGSAGLRVLYNRETDETKKLALLDETAAVTFRYAVVRSRQKDRAAHGIGLGALRQLLGLRKPHTEQSLNQALLMYRELCRWQDRDGMSDSHTLELIGHGETILHGMFALDHDPMWLQWLLEELARFRKLLPQCGNRESWVADKLAESLSMDRRACRTLLEAKPDAQTQERYLQLADEQLRLLGEGHQNTLEEILGELWQMEPLSETVRNHLLDTAEELTGVLRGMEDDLMYLMYQAIRDLGSDASVQEAEAYVAARRAAMKQE